MGNGTYVKGQYPSFTSKPVACYLPQNRKMIMFEEKAAKNFVGTNYEEIHCFCTAVKNPNFYDAFLNNTLKNNLDRQSLTEILNAFPGDARTPLVKKKITLLQGSYFDIINDAGKYELLNDPDIFTEATKRINSLTSFEAFIKQFNNKNIEVAFQTYIINTYNISSADFVQIARKYNNLAYFSQALDKQISNTSNLDDFKKICAANPDLCQKLEEGALNKVYQSKTSFKCSEFVSAFPNSKNVNKITEYGIQLKKQEDDAAQAAIEKRRREREAQERWERNNSSSSSGSSSGTCKIKKISSKNEYNFGNETEVNKYKITKPNGDYLVFTGHGQKKSSGGYSDWYHVTTSDSNGSPCEGSYGNKFIDNEQDFLNQVAKSLCECSSWTWEQ